MARKLSRRALALHVATHLVDGKPQKDIAQQLAAYLIWTRRTSELSLIVRDIQFYLAEHGHIAGTVSSAHELTASTLKEIEAYTKAQLGAKHVSLDTNIDESLLGGIKLEVPGYELDSTIARQLTTLKTKYKKA